MAIKFRMRCPKCGETFNTERSIPCPECRNEMTVEQPGMLQLYRMGNFMGAAGGFGIYINGEPYGHIGNRESLRFPLAYGTYTLHIAAGMSRRCNDLTFTLSPENPVVYAKTYMKTGFWTNSFGIDLAKPEDMPKD